MTRSLTNYYPSRFHRDRRCCGNDQCGTPCRSPLYSAYTAPPWLTSQGHKHPGAVTRKSLSVTDQVLFLTRWILSDNHHLWAPGHVEYDPATRNMKTESDKHCKPTESFNNWQSMTLKYGSPKQYDSPTLLKQLLFKILSRQYCIIWEVKKAIPERAKRPTPSGCSRQSPAVWIQDRYTRLKHRKTCNIHQLHSGTDKTKRSETGAISLRSVKEEDCTHNDIPLATIFTKQRETEIAHKQRPSKARIKSWKWLR